MTGEIQVGKVQAGLYNIDRPLHPSTATSQGSYSIVTMGFRAPSKAFAKVSEFVMRFFNDFYQIIPKSATRNE